MINPAAYKQLMDKLSTLAAEKQVRVCDMELKLTPEAQELLEGLNDEETRFLFRELTRPRQAGDEREQVLEQAHVQVAGRPASGCRRSVGTASGRVGSEKRPRSLILLSLLVI